MKKFSSQYYIKFLIYMTACLILIIASNYNLRLIIVSFILSILLTYMHSTSVMVSDIGIKIGRDLAFWTKKQNYYFSDMIKIRINSNPKTSEMVMYFKNGKKKTKILGCNVHKLSQYLKDYIQVEYYSGNTKIKI